MSSSRFLERLRGILSIDIESVFFHRRAMVLQMDYPQNNISRPSVKGQSAEEPLSA